VFFRGRDQALTPTVALTFDDGPSAHTLEILAMLADSNQRATFFVIGKHIKGNEDILRTLVLGKNEIGLHGWDHSRISTLTVSELRGQIRMCRTAVRRACGVDPKWWRSPWGRTENTAAEIILGSGLRIAPLGIDVFDCERSAGKIVDLVRERLTDESIVCLHDGVAPNGREKTKSRVETVKAVGELLGHCRSVTLSELIG
jgi:peptidoglycan/xylan/chitin deacetylase (PgdA/CDA1 family)